MPVRPKTDWAKAIKPLLKKYKGRKHPLDYKNIYQLIVMVVLSARDTDKHINNIAIDLFKKFPTFQSLAKAKPSQLLKFISKVTNGKNKTNWLLAIADKFKDEKKISLKMDELVELPGIGRKSANVIMREAKVKPEGVIVDLHVVRVAPRLGIAKGNDPKKIEEQIMNVIPQKDWGETGMAISFLGREICRPKNPMHDECIMNSVCAYYSALNKKVRKKQLATFIA